MPRPVRLVELRSARLVDEEEGGAELGREGHLVGRVHLHQRLDAEDSASVEKRGEVGRRRRRNEKNGIGAV